MDAIISLAGDLILPYLILSLFTMLIVEILSRVLGLRERILDTFLKNMFGYQGSGGFDVNFLNHPLLRSTLLGRTRPAYLPSRLFALAFRDEFTQNGEASLAEALPTLPNKLIQKELRALLFGTPPDREIDALQRWFVEVMDQAAAVYRVRTFKMIAAVAIIIVLALNFDALRIARHAVHRSLVQKTFEAEVQSIAKTAESQSAVTEPVRPDPNAPMRSVSVVDIRRAESVLEDATAREIVFPIGWSGDYWSGSTSNTLMGWLVLKIAGLGTSVLAVMLGAPLLFDTLNKYMVVRLAIKPFESGPAEN